jgi:hypothetical protein
LAGGVYLSRGWWWRELKEANKPTCQLNDTKTVPKMGGFLLILAEKSLRTQFFAQNVLKNIYSQDFFEEYINFKTFSYLKVHMHEIL